MAAEPKPQVALHPAEQSREETHKPQVAEAMAPSQEVPVGQATQTPPSQVQLAAVHADWGVMPEQVEALQSVMHSH